MASVWAARLGGQAGFSKLVAVKTTLPHLADVTEIRRMLLDEARIAARLHHPNVVTIYELGDEAGVPYVVMEWLNCAALDQLLSASADGPKGTPDPRLAARIIADACAGLHAAHELTDDLGQALGVVHRDVSPHNILISADGAVKVADFGIVKSRGQLHLTAAGGNARGRLSYMAPEHVTGEAVDRRADVFALGCTLHEVLTGEMVFAGTNDAQVIMAITSGRYEPRPRHVERAPGLFAVVARALARAPGDRYATADGMRLALEEWLEKNAPPIATAADIAAFVRARVGPELDEREARLRDEMAAGVASLRRRPHGEDAAPLRRTNPNAAPAAPPKTIATAAATRQASPPGEEMFSPVPIFRPLPPAAERRPLPWRATVSIGFVATFVALGAHATLSVTSRGSRESHRDGVTVPLSATPAASSLPAGAGPPVVVEAARGLVPTQAPDAAVRLAPARRDRTAAPAGPTSRPYGVPADDLPVNPY